MKICTSCKAQKPYSCFVKNRATKDGYTTKCKPCRNSLVNKHNNLRRQRQIESAGVLPGRCDVCQVKLETGRGVRGACWDHDHKTGKFRGWLCSNCNKALGLAKDSPERLLALRDYLLRLRQKV